jgi:two-component system sensor kinase FixL
MKELGGPGEAADLSTQAEMQRLVHELQDRQAELEMQNHELRQARAELEAALERIRDLYDNAPVAYFTLADDGRIEKHNFAAATLLGTDRAQLLGRHLESFVRAESQDAFRAFFSAALQTPPTRPQEVVCDMVIVGCDGAVRNVHAQGLAGADGRSCRVTVTDVTEQRRQAEAQLSASEERLRLAQEVAGIGSYDYDLLSGAFQCDQRLRDLWGVAAEESMSYGSLLAGVHPEDRTNREAILARAMDPAGDGRFQAEYRVVGRSDGSVRHVASTGKTFFAAGRPVRIVGTVLDISGRKRLEAELGERRGEMEALLQQQVAAHTAAAIAHELNQPLVAVSAYSEAALRILADGIDDRHKLVRALQGSVDQAQRAGRKLHELLDFLHTDEAEVGPLEINALVREALSIARDEGYGGFQTLLDLEPGLRPVLGNRRQVQKVLVNLVHNGVDAMRAAGLPAGAITIAVRTLAGQSMAQVTVRDSGPGLDAETARRAFEPFFSTKPRGIGLGLAISRALVEAHGGQLWLDPDSAPGATFHFTLPFADE